MAMIFLSATSFAQSSVSGTQSIKQEKRTAKTYFDLMVNVTSTNIYYGESNSALSDYKKSSKGIQAGASFQAGITPSFSLVTEFYFMRKGGKLKANNPLTNTESSLLFNTLELPVMARFHAGKFYFNAGPSIAYNLSGKQEINELSSKLSFTNKGEGFKRFEAGIQMGGGIEIPFKEKRIALDIRYVHGLTNLSYDREIYNRGLMITVHFSKAWKSNPFGRK
jgi:hypothetical protein